MASRRSWVRIPSAPPNDRGSSPDPWVTQRTGYIGNNLGPRSGGALGAFECVQNLEEARVWLNFVIIGAGVTGLELSGTLAQIARETLRHDFRKIDPQKARIILLEGAPKVLGPFPEDLDHDSP
jgi:hypothetical protein